MGTGLIKLPHEQISRWFVAGKWSADIEDILGFAYSSTYQVGRVQFRKDYVSVELSHERIPHGSTIDITYAERTGEITRIRIAYELPLPERPEENDGITHFEPARVLVR